jgi:hypothetical protein
MNMGDGYGGSETDRAMMMTQRGDGMAEEKQDLMI